MRIALARRSSAGSASRTSRRLGVALLVALATALVTVPASQAAPAATHCTVALSGPHWKIGAASGASYKIVAEGFSCAAARTWVTRYIHQTGKGLGQTLKGPAGFICMSYSQPASGDKLVYTGTCHHATGGVSFGWGPKTT